MNGPTSYLLSFLHIPYGDAIFTPVVVPTVNLVLAGVAILTTLLALWSYIQTRAAIARAEKYRTFASDAARSAAIAINLDPEIVMGFVQDGMTARLDQVELKMQQKREQEENETS